jgi:lipopolysaccharide transport system permease protein
MKTVVYFPDKLVKQGYLHLFGDMAGDALESRYLTWQLFKRSFNATYRQSVLGILWAFIIPLASVGTFVFLNNAGIFQFGAIAVPYPLYAVAGTALWQIFSVGLNLSANSLVSAGSLITRVNFARESLVVSATIQGIMPCAVQLVLVFLLFAYYRLTPPLTIFLLPLAVLPLLLLTLGAGFFLALANGVMRDVGNGVAALITFLVFLTPVLYEKPAGGLAAAITNYNPLYYLITVPRDLLLTGQTAELPGFLLATLFAVVVFLVGWTAFHLTETRIAERI